MTRAQAQRLRFGILAARHSLERDRLTPDQVKDLEGMELAGWIIGDWGTQRAFNREWTAAQHREYRSELDWMWPIERL